MGGLTDGPGGHCARTVGSLLYVEPGTHRLGNRAEQGAQVLGVGECGDAGRTLAAVGWTWSQK